MLHKRGLYVPDATEKASMQMYSPLSIALLWKVLLPSSILNLKLPALKILCMPEEYRGDVFAELFLSE